MTNSIYTPKFYPYQHKLLEDLSQSFDGVSYGFNGLRLGAKTLASAIQVNKLSNSLDRPALEPADEKKLKALERRYQLAKVRHDKVQMSCIEKEIVSIRVRRMFK